MKIFCLLATTFTLLCQAHAELVSYWSFDTDATDSTGAHNGTLVNGASISTGTQGFGGGEALSLAGGAGLAAAQHMSTSNPTTFDFDTDFTWHAYIKTTTNDGGIFGRAPAATIHNQGSKSLFLGGANVQWDTGWVGAPSSGVAATDDAWHQIIVTFSAATDQLDIFVDPTAGATTGQFSGVHDANAFDESTTHNGGKAETAFFIGLVSDNFRNTGFVGLIDEAAVFNTALAGAELDQLINSGPEAFLTTEGDPALQIPLAAILDPTSLQQGAVTRSLNVRNTGANQTLTITNVTFEGGDAALFTTPTFPATLAPDEAGEIGFTFTPTAPGNFSTTMVIISNAFEMETIMVTLQIEALNDPSLVAPADFVLTTIEIPATASTTGSIPVSNAGLLEPLNISSVTFGGANPELFSGPAFPATLTPGASGTIDFTFTPVGSGVFTAVAQIASNSQSGATTNVNLKIAVIGKSELPGGLLAYWSFDADASDSTGNHDGTLVNGASISTGTQGFGGGEALSLAGGAGLAAAQHMSAENPSAFDFDTDFTWHAYIKTTTDNGGIFGRAPSATIHNQGSKSLFLGGANVQWDTGWVGAPSSGVAATDDAWHQIIVTFSAATDQLDIFVDPTAGATTGQFSGVHNVNAFDESTTHNGGKAETAFFIGLVSDNFRNTGFVGLIDEAALFDTALAGAELDQLITQGPGSFAEAGDDLEFTDITIAPDETITLTWKSKPGMIYTLNFNTDLEDWSATLTDDFDSGGMTTTFGPFPNPYDADGNAPFDPLPREIFFRVTENPGN